MRPRWPLPMGAVRSMTRAVVVFLPCSHEQALVGEHRGQVGELRAQGHDLGGHAVDGRHLLQGRELVVGARRARRARDHVALEQAVLADGGEPHVDVVLAGQVAGGAQKAVAVAHDVQHAGDLGEALGLADGLVDGVHQLGLLQARGIHPGLGGASAQVGHLELCQLLLGDGGLRLSVAILVAVLLVLLAALAILGALLVLAVLLALALAVLVLAALVLAALLAVAAADHRRGGALAARSLLGLGGIGGRGRLGRAGARCGRLGALGLLGLRGLLLRARPSARMPPYGRGRGAAWEPLRKSRKS